MKNVFTLVCTLAFAAVAAVGCAKQKQPAGASAVNDSVTDITVAPVPPREPEAAFLTPATPAPADPAFVAPAVIETPAAQTSVGGSYVVKKGDTLFSIAKANYGNGNQWQRIANANPGLSPSTLKAGQTIVLP